VKISIRSYIKIKGLAWVVCLSLACLPGCTGTPSARKITSPKGGSFFPPEPAPIERQVSAPLEHTPEPIEEPPPLVSPEPVAITTAPPKEKAPAPVKAPIPIVMKPLIIEAPAKKIDVEAERQALLQRDVAFSETSEKKGAAQAFYEFMTADATLLQTGDPPIKGIETIKVRMAAGEQGTLTWKPEEASVAASGDMGYTWGNFEFKSQNPDRKPTYGKYVSVWKKQEDGSWKAVLCSVNSSPDRGARRSESDPQ